MKQLEGKPIIWKKHNPRKPLEPERVGAAFLKFGIAYEEFTDGPAHLSTAIIMDQSGNLHNVDVECISFDSREFRKLLAEED